MGKFVEIRGWGQREGKGQKEPDDGHGADEVNICVYRLDPFVVLLCAAPNQ